MEQELVKTDNSLQETNHLNLSGAELEVEYDLFIDWCALPTIERNRLGLPFQKDFAKKYGLKEWTLSDWKNRPDFDKKRLSRIKRWAKNLTGNVILEHYEKIQKKDFDNPRYVELWYQFVEGFNLHKDALTGAVEANATAATLGNIKHLISILPENERQFYYNVIGQLIQRARQVVSDNQSSGERIPDERRIDTDVQAATDITNEASRSTSKVAEEATSDIRGHLDK